MSCIRWTRGQTGPLQVDHIANRSSSPQLLHVISPSFVCRRAHCVQLAPSRRRSQWSESAQQAEALTAALFETCFVLGQQAELLVFGSGVPPGPQTHVPILECCRWTRLGLLWRASACPPGNGGQHRAHLLEKGFDGGNVRKERLDSGDARRKNR